MENADMNTQANKRPRLQLLLGGIAAILVSGIAIASLTISSQNSSGALAPAELREAAAVAAIAVPGASAYRCAECGTITSTRKIEAPDELIRVHAPHRIALAKHRELEREPAGNYAITIRLQNGSTRVITDAKPAKWRPGEQVTIIAGVD